MKRMRPDWEHEKPGYRYGSWAGNEKGKARHPEHCVASVSDPPHYLISRQCSRPRGHGHEGLYCKQHARRYP